MFTEKKVDSIPAKIKFLYSDFELVSQTSYYKVFKVKSNKNTEILTKEKKYAIRVLDLQSPFVQQDYDAAATLFLQELLHLCSRTTDQDAFLIEDFIISGQQIAFVSLSYEQIPNGKQSEFIKDPVKFFDDIASDVHSITKIDSLDFQFSLQNIFRFNHMEEYFVGDWNTRAIVPVDDMKKSLGESTILKLNQSKISESIQNLSLSMITLTQNVSFRTLLTISSIEEDKGYLTAMEPYISAIKSTQLQKRIRKALGRNQEALNQLISEVETSRIISKRNPSAELAQSKTIHHLLLFISLANTKIAWCYSKSNLISTYDIAKNKAIIEGSQGPQLTGETGIKVLLRIFHYQRIRHEHIS